MAALRLGESIDAATRSATGPLDLTASDLTTHACIVGMTGSGKTGLGVVLIEECLRAGVSVLAIDPKGDLPNLRLLFPEQEVADFERWLDAPARSGTGRTLAEEALAARERALEGLARAGLGRADVAALAAGHDAVVHTPGSRAGVPLALVSALAPPPGQPPEDELREGVAATAGSLLALAGLDPDPIRSRDAVLVGLVLEASWRAGRTLDLSALIRHVIDPPFDRLGALPLESAFPARERGALGLRLNGLIASPTFAGFLEGEPLDFDRIFPGGPRPRLTIVSIAHLGEAERCFVTAVIAERLRSWLRTRPGSAELRGLFFLDEVAGLLPPHPANPPTKPPLLALLKQARAFGMGLVLATQNPVDLDYKALSNMGTWMVGRLQTEQDQARLAEGLQAAVRAGGGDPGRAIGLLGALERRVFLVQDAHRTGPELLRTRWAMSYLRGPMTREEIARLVPASGVAERPATRPRASDGGERPLAPPWIEERYVAGADWARPHLLVKAAVRYKVERGVEESRTVLKAFPIRSDVAAELLEAEARDIEEGALATEPAPGMRFASLETNPLANRKEVERAVRDRLPAKLALTLLFDPRTRTLARPGETREDFARRIAAEQGEGKGRDLALRIERKQQDMAAAASDLSARKSEKWVALASAVVQNLGLVFGRKRTVSGAATVLSKNRMQGTAEARTEKIRAELSALVEEHRALLAVEPSRFEERQVQPARADVDVLRIELAWIG